MGGLRTEDIEVARKDYGEVCCWAQLAGGYELTFSFGKKWTSGGGEKMASSLDLSLNAWVRVQVPPPVVRNLIFQISFHSFFVIKHTLRKKIC